MKAAKSLILSVFLVLMLATSSFAANLGTLYYWYSDYYLIVKWSSKSPDYWYEVADTSMTLGNLGNYVGHAVSQWNGAGMNSAKAYNKSSADIKIYGGTYETLKIMEPSLTSSNTGLTDWTGETYIGEYYYNGHEIGTYQPTGANVYIVQKSGKTDNGYKNTTTHELGHAFGWYGHTSYSSDVMYAYATEITILTSRDKNHLMQIY